MTDDALAAAAGEDARLDAHLGVEAAVRDSAHSRVLPLGVLAHEEQVDVLRPATRQRARHALEQPRRAEVRPEIQALPDRQDRPPQRDVIRHRRVSERPEQHRVELAQLLERVLGHHPALLVEVARSPTAAP